MTISRSTPLLRRAGALLLVLLAACGGGSEAGERHMLYKVEGPQGTTYLMGSIHAMSDDAYPLAPPLDSAFAAAERVFFEVNLDSVEARAPEMVMKAMYDNGQTLQKALSPETYARLSETLPKYGLSAGLLDGMEPWMVALTLSQMEYQKSGMTPEKGLDLHFMRKAGEAGKPVGALESADFQLGLFDSFSPAEQEEFLQSTLKDLDRTASMMRDLQAAWKAGDAERIGTVMDESLRDYPGIRAKLLTDRNEAWVPQIETMLKEPGDELVVVGAAHLAGRGSVVEMLRSKGHKVEQM